MRWLALKDLQILRRSPLIVGLLLIYPVALSLLVGKAVNSGPAKPRVAVVNQIPSSAARFSLGNEHIDANKYANELFKAIDPVRVKTVAQALEKVRSGDALAALVVPADITDRLQGAINLQTSAPPTVDFYYTGDDPLKSRYVQSALKGRVSDANRALSAKITGVAARYLNIILSGGRFNLLGTSFDVLGLKNSKSIVDAVIAKLPAHDPERQALQHVSSFAQLAIDNLDLSDQLLGTIGAPIHVRQHVLGGGGSINSFYFATAVAIALMFVCVLLGAGLLALEREENAFGRLVRGLVSRLAIVAEKALLAGLLGGLAAAVMLGVLAAGYGVDAGRVPAALAVIALGGAAFGAFGVALGAVAREVRAASLLGVLVLLPVAALGLVPSGTVSGGTYDAIRTVSALFPFRPVLRGVEAGLVGNGLGVYLLHLAALVVAYTALGRIALRRLG
jgi:ABC-type multidrug transport system permease subunit